MGLNYLKETLAKDNEYIFISDFKVNPGFRIQEGSRGGEKRVYLAGRL